MIFFETRYIYLLNIQTRRLVNNEMQFVKNQCDTKCALSFSFFLFVLHGAKECPNF